MWLLKLKSSSKCNPVLNCVSKWEDYVTGKMLLYGKACFKINSSIVQVFTELIRCVLSSSVACPVFMYRDMRSLSKRDVFTVDCKGATPQCYSVWYRITTSWEAVLFHQLSRLRISLCMWQRKSTYEAEPPDPRSSTRKCLNHGSNLSRCRMIITWNEKEFLNKGLFVAYNIRAICTPRRLTGIDKQNTHVKLLYLIKFYQKSFQLIFFNTIAPFSWSFLLPNIFYTENRTAKKVALQQQGWM